MKRGQVTFFTIVALLVIVIAVFITYLMPPRIKTEFPSAISLPPHLQSVHNMVNTCLSFAAKNAVLVTAARGGSYTPKKVYEYPPLLISYLYNQGQSLLPTLQEMETSIAKVTRDLAQECVDFSRFPTLKITPVRAMESTAIIDENKVTIQTTYPLTIIKDAVKSDLSIPYTHTVAVNLKRVYNALSLINNNIQKDPSSVPLSTTLQTGMNVEVMSLDEKTFLYVLTDRQSIIDDLPLTIIFAVGV